MVVVGVGGGLECGCDHIHFPGEPLAEEIPFMNVGTLFVETR